MYRLLFCWHNFETRREIPVGLTMNMEIETSPSTTYSTSSFQWGIQDGKRNKCAKICLLLVLQAHAVL